MLQERITLSNDSVAYMDTYALTYDKISPRDALLVIPGGGYASVSIEREGEAIALTFASKGINCFVLNYHVGPVHNYPTQLLDAARAFAYIKDNAERYHINPDRIFVIGFSAGAHLAECLALRHGVAEEHLGREAGSLRPYGVLLAYPVVTAMHATHVRSYENLTGTAFEEISEEVRRFHSHELHVTPEAPPTFIWHTATDTAVPPVGSLRLAEAYINAGVRVELHLYPTGPHGIALATELTSVGKDIYINEEAAKWVDEAYEFIKAV